MLYSTWVPRTLFPSTGSDISPCQQQGDHHQHGRARRHLDPQALGDPRVGGGEHLRGEGDARRLFANVAGVAARLSDGNRDGDKTRHRGLLLLLSGPAVEPEGAVLPPEELRSWPGGGGTLEAGGKAEGAWRQGHCHGGRAGQGGLRAYAGGQGAQVQEVAVAAPGVSPELEAGEALDREEVGRQGGEKVALQGEGAEGRAVGEDGAAEHREAVVG